MQIPTDVPNPDNNSPIDLTSPLEIVVYIVIPLVMLAIYFWVRRKGKSAIKDQEGSES
ncbi:MAG: hypothetical protein Aureis2KO_11570 [Aureisphaera sp.]